MKEVIEVPIKWLMVNEEYLTATFYETNITLNKVSSSYFEDAYKVLIGLDLTNKMVVIKNLNKAEAQRGNIDKNQLMDIRIRPSYGRISSKKIMGEIQKAFNLNYNDHLKYKATWDLNEKILKIDLKEVI